MRVGVSCVCVCVCERVTWPSLHVNVDVSMGSVHKKRHRWHSSHWMVAWGFFLTCANSCSLGRSFPTSTHGGPEQNTRFSNKQKPERMLNEDERMMNE
jgi:hypothetical protein